MLTRGAQSMWSPPRQLSFASLLLSLCWAVFACAQPRTAPNLKLSQVALAGDDEFDNSTPGIGRRLYADTSSAAVQHKRQVTLDAVRVALSAAHHALDVAETLLSDSQTLQPLADEFELPCAHDADWIREETVADTVALSDKRSALPVENLQRQAVAAPPRLEGRPISDAWWYRALDNTQRFLKSVWGNGEPEPQASMTSLLGEWLLQPTSCQQHHDHAAGAGSARAAATSARFRSNVRYHHFRSGGGGDEAMLQHPSLKLLPDTATRSRLMLPGVPVDSLLQPWRRMALLERVGSRRLTQQAETQAQPQPQPLAKPDPNTPPLPQPTYINVPGVFHLQRDPNTGQTNMRVGSQFWPIVSIEQPASPSPASPSSPSPSPSSPPPSPSSQATSPTSSTAESNLQGTTPAPSPQATPKLMFS